MGIDRSSSSGVLAWGGVDNSTVQCLMRPLRPLLCRFCECELPTAEHGQRTSLLALRLGQACSLDAHELTVLDAAAKLHDIGKIEIPQDVLHKPGRLSDEEREIVKSHSDRGYKMLKSLCPVCAKEMETVAVIVRHHHEAFDGSGYPHGLVGENIPVLSRIVSLADSYAALASARSYHHPRCHQSIMDVLHGENGHLYDPYLRQLFARVIPNGERTVS